MARIALALLLLNVFAFPLSAQEPAARTAQDNRNVGFRPILIPDDKKAGFVRGYMPIRKARFHELWSKYAAKNGPAPIHARITQARYRAELSGGTWTGGDAELDVEPLTKRPAQIDLGKLSIAVRSPAWRSSQEPPLWGADSGGRTRLLVEKKGQLGFRWTLRGEQTALGETQYDFELPPSLANVLELTTPAGVTLRSDGGIVSRQAIDTSAGDSPTLWQIETGGRSSFSVFTKDDRQPRTRTLSVVQQADYVLDQRGVEATIVLQPRVRGGSLTTLELIADPTLVLIDVAQGAVSLPDEAIDIQTNDGQQAWTFEFAKPLRSESEPIRIRAFSRFDRDEIWRLPQVRVEQEQWSSTLVSVEMDPQLELQRHETRASHHQGVSRAANGNLRLQFQHLQADGEVDLLIGEQQIQARVDSGLHLLLDRDRVTGRLVADISSDRGEAYSVLMRRAADWRIVSVTAEPPDAIQTDEVNWESEDEFVIPLSIPATRDSKVRLIVEGVRDYPGATRRIPLRVGRLASFSEASSERRLVRITAGGGSQSTLSQDVGIFRLAPSELFEAEVDRLGGASGVLLEDSSRVGDAVASIRPQVSSFDATIDVEAEVESKRLIETYRIRCTPDSLSLNEIRVQLSQGREEDVVWTINGSPGEIVAERSESIKDGPETWRLSLRRPTAEPVEIVGRRESGDVAQQFRVSLADVLGAATQVSTIVVRSGDATPLRLTPDALDAGPFPVASPGRVNEVRGVFRHEPPRRASLGVERLAAQPACWVWRMLVKAQVEATGVIGYEAALQLENSGRSKLALQVPTSIVDWLVYVDDEEVAAIRDGDVITVPLPSDRARPRVVLRYRTEGEAVRWVGRSTLAGPLPDVDVLRRDWQVVLPAGFERWPSSNAESDWRSRLLGGSLGGLIQTLQDEVAAAQAFFRDEQQVLHRIFGEAVESPEQLESLEVMRRVSNLLSLERVELNVATDEVVRVRVLAAERPSELAGPADEIGRRWLEDNGFTLFQRDGKWILSLRERESSASETLLPISDWIERLDGEAGSAGGGGDKLHNRRQLSFHDAETIEVAYFHQQTFAAWEWCVLCLAVAIGLRLAFRFRAAALLVCGLLFGLTLWVAPGWVFWTRGAAFGFGIAFCVSYLARRSRPQPQPAQRGDDGSTRTLTAAAVISSVLLLALFLGYASAVQAQQEVDQFGLPNDRPNLLIPADGDLNPVGDFFYIPLSLYRELALQDDWNGESGDDWLIRDASYTVRAEDANSLADVQAILSIHVFRPGAIRLSFPAAEVRDVYWNGRPVEYATRDGQIEFAAQQAGMGELEVVLEPAASEESLFAMPTPSAGRAEVVFEGVDGLEAVTFPTARGEVRQNSPNRWTAELGGGQLQVGWRGLGQPADFREIEAEELYWLRVRPRSVSVDARIVLRPLRNDVTQFTLLADPSLQLLNIGREQGIEKHEVAPTSGDWNLHRFELVEPIVNERAVELSFLWKGQAGLARISAPRLRVDAKYVRDRRLAFSVAQPLLWNLTRDERWEPLAPAEFAAAWGDEGAPLAAFRAPRDDVSWSLQTRFPPANGDGTAELVVVVENSQLTCELLAEFAAQQPERFQRRILAPSGFKLESATLTDSMRDRDLQARQEEDGSITLFHERPWSEDQRLTLKGTIPRDGKKASLPKFQLESGDLKLNTIRVYRRPNVTPLAWLQIKGFETQPLERGEFTAKYGRLEAVLARTSGEVEIEISSSLKRPSAVNGAIVTTLTREDGQWLATANLGLNVANKSPMDVIRFDVPAEWTDLELEPAWAFRLAPLPAPDRRQLIVYPDAPTLKATVSIRGRLSIGAEERLRYAPEITPLDTRSMRRYLVLPSKLENQRYVWELSGREEQPPEHLRPKLPAVGEYQYFLAVGRARASVQVESQPAGQVRIRTADYRVRWLGERSGLGVAEFDIEPSGAAFCLLSTPANVRLLRISVDNIEQPLRNPDARNVSISFGAEQLPHRISVVFRITDANVPHQSAPFLSDESNEPLPCQATLWTVESPSGQALRNVVARTIDRETNSSLRARRLEALNRLVLDVAQRDSAAPQQDLAVWYRAWAGRMNALQESLELNMELRSDKDDPVIESTRQISDALADASEAQSRAAERFGDPSEGYVDTHGASHGWDLSARSDAATAYLSFKQSQQFLVPAIAVDTAAADPQGRPLSPLAATLIAGCAIFAIVRRRENRELFFSSPHTWLLAAGLLWWALMPLPWLGLAFGLVMLASSFNSNWRTARR